MIQIKKKCRKIIKADDRAALLFVARHTTKMSSGRFLVSGKLRRIQHTSRKLSKGVFTPAVVCQIAALEELSVFFLSGKIIIEITADLFGSDTAFSVYRFYDIGDTVFLQNIFQAEGYFSVAGERNGADRLILPQEGNSFFGRNEAASSVYEKSKKLF